MKFNLKKYSKGIGVENQTLEVEFAHCRKIDGNWTNQTDFSVCRDFMGDAIYAMEIGKTVGIYGFSYNPKKTPLYTNKCVVGVRFPNIGVMNQFILNFSLLSKMPKIFAVKDMDIFYDDLIIVLTFNSLWGKSTFAISYLTFLLKCMCYELDHDKDLLNQIETMKFTKKNEWSDEVDEVHIKEAGYLAETKELLAKLPKVITKLLKKLPNSHGMHDPDTHTVHNNSGFYSTLRWKKNETWKLAEGLLK